MSELRFFEDLEAEFERAVRRSHRHRRGLWSVVAASGTALSAAAVVAILLLSSGTSVAYAGWSATPTPPTAAAVAAARDACGGVPKSAVLASEARGPYVAIVYKRQGTPWQCVVDGDKRLLDKSTEYPPSVVIKPGAGKVSLPLINHTVNSDATARMKMLNSKRAHLFREDPAPRAAIAEVIQAIFELDTGANSLTAVSGFVGPGVTGVTIALRDGTRVRATVGRGWYLAWWPGTTKPSFSEPAAIQVTTATATSHAPYSASYLRRYYEPCLFRKACVEQVSLPVKSGISAKITRTFGIFRSGTKSSELPKRFRPLIQRLGSGPLADLGIDPSAAREVSFGRLGSMLAVPGTEGVCTFYLPPRGGVLGACGPISSARHLIAGGTGQTNGRYVVHGIVPDGYNTVVVRFPTGAKVDVPVKHNLFLGTFMTKPNGMTSTNGSGQVLR